MMGAIPRYPNFSLENAKQAEYPNATIIGIDEAGRGPWAGPVVAGAAWISPDAVNDLPADLTDSKKLSENRRQRIYNDLIELAKDNTKLRLATGEISASDIDQIGILPATFLAMQKASDQIYKNFSRHTEESHAIILVDGSICPDLSSPSFSTQVQAVVKGDLKVISIAAASIMAKVTRDQIMIDLARAYPEYGWEKNKGYGTKEHQLALANHGITPYHRLSFRPLAKFS